MHASSFKDRHFVAKELLKLNNMTSTYLIIVHEIPTKLIKKQEWILCDDLNLEMHMVENLVTRSLIYQNFGNLCRIRI